MLSCSIGDRHRGKCWVHTRAGDEDARVADEKIFNVVRLTERVHHGGSRIIAHPAATHCMGAIVQAEAYFFRAGSGHHLSRFITGCGGQFHVILAPLIGYLSDGHASAIE